MKVKVNVKHVSQNQVEYFLNEALSEALADLDAAHYEIKRLTKQIADKDSRIDELLGQIAANKMDLDKKEIEDWKRTAENLANMVRSIELEKNEAYARIDELQKLLVDANDTITSLKAQIELKPKFVNLWSFLKENGLIVNTEKGPHNVV